MIIFGNDINGFVEAYKKYGNTPKLYNGFCPYVHNASTGNVEGGLIRRRKVEWILYTSGFVLKDVSNQSTDNDQQCIGNFNIPNDKKNSVNKLLENTASEFNGKITYY